MDCECANRLSCVNRPGFVCVCIFSNVGHSYSLAGADWPSGEPGEFPVAWQPIWPAALHIFVVVVVGCRMY